MKRFYRPILYSLLLALTLSACGGNPEPTSPTTTNPTAAPTTGTGSNPTPAATTGAASNPTATTGASNQPPLSGNGASVIRVVVTGGPHAGTYERSSVDQ